MRWLQTVERQGGRERAQEERWGPRAIDIDLLAYDDLTYKDHLVTLPHPRMHERSFVLRPMADIAPDWQHPGTGLTVREMLESSQ
jgi:2-amino-4-hydroxy-6-hydroxymethyldihydropteridine diphosphokinase